MLPPFRARSLTVAALALAASALAGCNYDRQITGSTPESYATRHPILVSEGDAVLDLPVGGGPGGLTDRQRREVAVLAADWRKSGRGYVVLQVPRGGATDIAAARTVPEIRTLLAAQGVPATAVLTQAYAAAGPTHLAPLRLSFPKLTAKVPHPCGLWPDDLARGDGGANGGSKNYDYWNFGCASQQNLAAMVADPEDLVRPRPIDPPYAARRQTVIEKYSKGESTATEYPRENETDASEVGGQ